MRLEPDRSKAPAPAVALAWIVVVSASLGVLQAAAAQAAFAAGASPAATDQRFGDGGVSAFYQFAGLLPRVPGRMIRSEPLVATKLPSSAAKGVRLLYSSTNGVGTPRRLAVSGQIFFPKGVMPKGGWPVVAWEHGTTGVADVCAPSWRGFLTRDRTYLNRWLDEGFAVVATDYQGLGTPGPHPYLLYRPEGYSALDGVKAALGAYPATLRNRVVLVGQSQGSGAALSAAWLAPVYASRLHILGVVATGLVVDFEPNPKAVHKPLPVQYEDAESLNAAFAMLEVEGTDQSLHPDVDDRRFMTTSGIALSHIARTGCLGDLFKATQVQDISTKSLFAGSLSPLEKGKWKASHIPNAMIRVPIFAGTGLADTEASLPGQYNAVAALCDAGTRVTWQTYPGLTHNGTVNISLADSVPFVKRLLAGESIQSACSTITPPGPAQQPKPGVPFND